MVQSLSKKAGYLVKWTAVSLLVIIYPHREAIKFTAILPLFCVNSEVEG